MCGKLLIWMFVQHTLELVDYLPEGLETLDEEELHVFSQTGRV